VFPITYLKYPSVLHKPDSITATVSSKHQISLVPINTSFHDIPTLSLCRGDAFLEPYVQGLAPPDFTSSQQHTSAPPAEQTPHTATPEDGGSVTSSPVGDNHNTLADLSAQFRLLELDGSADSLDHVSIFPNCCLWNTSYILIGWEGLDCFTGGLITKLIPAVWTRKEFVRCTNK
jgi:hypothetical protein